MTGAHLLLKVTEFEDSENWHWVLSDDGGHFIGDHEVSLDLGDWEYEAFIDLNGYLEVHSSPDKKIEDQEGTLEEVGAWIGHEVFGNLGSRILEWAPVTVHVKVPLVASGIVNMPLELAYARNRPLALHDVSLVFEVSGEDTSPRKRHVEDRLRMLAVFSTPTGEFPLSLRRERYDLVRQIRDIALTRRVAIDLRVLQYGVTRETLIDVLEEGEGWDLVHISGHGKQATLLLEKKDGTADPVSSEELVELLHASRDKIKLVTLSSCLSAASTIEETFRWLGIENPRPEVVESYGDDGWVIASLARTLVQRLDCAVLAMRYPVGDEFAIYLGRELYRGLLDKKQPLTRALQLALPKALGDGHNASVPPISVATPALFGTRVADLRLVPPEVREPRTPDVRLAGFPEEPRRFVGRVDTMARASTALAPRSGKNGVFFYGMVGGGKTACALELVHHHHRSRRFETFVWYEAPKKGDIEGALSELALVMEEKMGLRMVHLVDRREEFERWLPVLTKWLEESNTLIVLDNLETLLTHRGSWRDERWGSLIKAMLSHNGLSRLVLTSRQRPVNLEDDRLEVETVNALSLQESALLARELPNLGRLLLDDTTEELGDGRGLVARALNLVQGHPKLIELAEGQAADPAKLEDLLEQVAIGPDDSRLQDFFQRGVSSLEAEEFLLALTEWTKGISAILPEGSRCLFHFLCALEESDRLSYVVEMVWLNFCQLLGTGEVPPIKPLLRDLDKAGLVDILPLDVNQFKYRVHPGVAEAGSEEFDAGFQEKANNVMAAFWESLFRQAVDAEEILGSTRVVLSGLKAAHYLFRQERWSEADMFLELVVDRDNSFGTLARVLPYLRSIARETEGTDEGEKAALVLDKALRMAGRPMMDENELKSRIRNAAEKGDFRSASVTAGNLVIFLRDMGRIDEALVVVEEMRNYIQKGNLGPLSQLGGEGVRLQILALAGQNDEVLAALGRLRKEMRGLPFDRIKEIYEPWQVRETIFDAGSIAAQNSRRWALALELNDEVVKSKKLRSAPILEITRSEFNANGTLLQLGRYNDAEDLLMRCCESFLKENDVPYLGKIYGALADLKIKMKHPEEAIRLAETAIRYVYKTMNPESCAIGHYQLAISFEEKDAMEKAVAHVLAASVIGLQINTRYLDETIRMLSDDLALVEPPTFEELCTTVEAVEGVRFREMIDSLPADGEDVLREVLDMARMRKEN